MSTAVSSRLRCAVYTRKSTEEGLDQAFNSLDAQREACEAYIRSQSSLGWKLVPDRYDDGGISGATMDRPALQRLLKDIGDNRVDVVVVYKIDRLTRSLSDFARIVEVFDQAQASFVSVTQQFNTTTSMGRLTLNVLLSFAQFEREVTAERIRDKIAASKQKGMWMGGGVPLGYRAVNRKLQIDEQEAAIVRYLFQRYLDLRSVKALMADATAQGFPERAVRTRKGANGGQGNPGVALVSPDAEAAATRRFGRGQLYHVLSNPIYIGKVRHHEKIYDGEHAPIIDQDTFAAAQALLAEQAPVRRTNSNQADIHLLAGLLFDEDGNRLTPVHTRRGNIRYRYYASKPDRDGRGVGKRGGWRLPARTIEEVVETELKRLLDDQRRLSEVLQPFIPARDMPNTLAAADALKTAYQSSSPQHRRDLLRRLITRIDLAATMLTLRVDMVRLVGELIGRAPAATEAGDADRIAIIECRFSLRRRGIETKIILADPSTEGRAPDDGLVRLIVKAHACLAQLTDGSGRGIGEIASANGVDRSDFSRILRLAFLAPDIVDRLLNGTHPTECTAQKLSRLTELPHSWAEQRALIGK